MQSGHINAAVFPRITVERQDLPGDPGPAGERGDPDAVQQVVEGHGRRLQQRREEERFQSQPSRHRQHRSVVFLFFFVFLDLFSFFIAIFPDMSTWSVRADHTWDMG